MLRTLVFATALLACACAPTLRRAASDAVEAPFQLSGAHIMVPVRLNGHDYLANYDSGAEVSLMSITIAQEQGIPTVPGEAGHGFGGDIESSVASNVRLDIGSGAYTFPNIAVVDFTPMIGPNARIFILGQTLFPESVIEIDMERRLLRWTPSAHYRAPAGASAMAMGFQNGSYTVPMRVNGVDGVAGVDLGSGTALDISRAYAERLGLDPANGATHQGSGVGGRYIKRATSIPVISLAGVEMRDVPVSIHEGPLPSEADINLGTPILFRYELALDYAGRRIWLTPTDTATAPFTRDLLGMTVGRRADHLEVTFVSDRGPAHDAGFAAGDRITAIDGVAIADIPADRPVLTGEAGATFQLATESGQTRALTLARYY
jgi:hypothetical protein